jgi:hypothetical protein
MGLLGDIDQVEACFRLFRDSVNLDTTYALNLHGTYNGLIKHFGRNQWYSYVTWPKWKLILVHLKIVLILTQHRCTVCSERTIGS